MGLQTLSDARARAAGAIALAILALGAAIVVASPSTGTALVPGFRPETWFYFHSYDSSGQRLAHKVVLLATVATMLGGPWLGRWAPARSFGAGLDGRRLERAIAASLIGGIAAGWAASGAWGQLALGAALLAAWWTRRLPRPDPAMIPAGLALICALGFLPGLIGTLDLSSQPPYLIGEVEFHYSMVVDPGRKLAQGYPLFEDAKVAYGLVMPLLIALWERANGPHTAVAYVRLVQVTQVAVVAAWTAAYVRRAKGDLLRALIPILLVAGGFNAFTPGNVEANQAGFRFFALAAVPLAIDAVATLAPGPRALLFGLLTGFGIVFNIETGIALAAGMGVYLFLRGGWAALPLRRIAADLAGLVVGAAAGIALLAVAWRAGLGAWPQLLHPQGLLADLLSFAGGYCGLKLTANPVPIAILAHAIYALVRIGLGARGPVGHDKSFRGMIATVIIVWFAYYANRPHPYNVATYLALWGFLLIDATPLAQRGRPIAAVLVYGLALPVAIVGLLAAVPGSAIAFARLALGPSAPDAQEISGIWVPADTAALIHRRSARVAREAEDGPVWYFTANSWFIPMETQVFPPYPFNNAFADLVTDARRDLLLDRIRAAHPARLLFDDGSAAGSGHALTIAAFGSLQHDLADEYDPVEVADGWRIWALKSTHAPERAP